MIKATSEKISVGFEICVEAEGNLEMLMNEYTAITRGLLKEVSREKGKALAKLCLIITVKKAILEAEQYEG